MRRGEKASYPPHRQCRLPVFLCPDRIRADSGRESRYPACRNGLAGREKLWEQPEREDTSSLSRNTAQHRGGKCKSCLIRMFRTALIGHINLHAPTLSARSSGGRETRLPAVETSRAGLTSVNTSHTRQWGESSSRAKLRLC